MAIGKRVGNRFANIGSGGNFFSDPKTFESEEARKLASQQGFQRFADALGMAAAYETGDAQRIALAQKQVQQRKIDRENKNLKDVMQSVDRSDYLDASTGTYDNKAYYRGMSSKLFDKGFIEQGIKLAELGTPTTSLEANKMILGERKQIEKQYKPVNDAVVGYKKLEDALQQEGGVAAYSALVLYMKNLDGSVVKEGEVRSFESAQGLLGNLEEKLSKTKGEGMTPEMRTQILNLARKGTKHMLDGYDANLEGSARTYNTMGMNSGLIFDGYLIGRNDLDFNPVEASFFESEITGTLE